MTSERSNIAYDNSGKFLLLPEQGKVGIWHIFGERCVNNLSPPPPSHGPCLSVSSIAPSPSSLVAVGYIDGSIRIWDLKKGTCEKTLKQHKGVVTALRYSKLRSFLASGGKKDGVILWVMVGEHEFLRLRGHSMEVTDVVFLDSVQKLVSSSVEFLKVWDLVTGCCIQTINGYKALIQSMDVDPHDRYLATGSTSSELRCYTIAKHGMVLVSSGEIQGQGEGRVAALRFNNSGSLLACHREGKTVEIFRILGEGESSGTAMLRYKRQKKNASDYFKSFQTLRLGKNICSISFSPINPDNFLATLALSTDANSLEIYSISRNSITQTQFIDLTFPHPNMRSPTPNSLDTFPYQVQIEILSRLLIKTLVLCACTSKDLFSLLSSHAFIDAHIRETNRSYHFFRYYRRNESPHWFFFLIPNKNINDQPGKRIIGLNMPRECDFEASTIVGSVNGVFCLSNATNTVLWNPAIQKCMCLPSPPIPSEDSFDFYVGFGFDHLTNEYKVVRIWYLDDDAPPEVHVFSITSRSWRRIGNAGGLTCKIIGRSKCSPCFQNGALHWVGKTDNDEPRIVTFLMHEESFQEIMMPDKCHFSEDWLVEVFKGRLVLSMCRYMDEICSFWLLDKYNKVESWRHLCDIKLRAKANRRVGFAFVHDDMIAVLIQTESDNHIMPMYDLNGTCVHDLYLMCGIHGTFSLGSHVDSLALLREGRPTTSDCHMF